MASKSGPRHPAAQAAANPDPGCEPTAEFLASLERVRRPLIAAHVTPDADAIGAALALAEVLRVHGRAPTVVLAPGTVATKLRFIFDLAPAVICRDEWQPAESHDALIALDTASAERLRMQPPPDLSGGLSVFNIDHHATNTGFGQHTWIDAAATSTCEMIARLLGRLGWEPDAKIASLLYAGIHNDTLGFSLPTTTARALRIAGNLIAKGADAALIGERIYRSLDAAAFELLRRTYEHTRVTAETPIAYSTLSYADITESGCTAEDIDDQVSVPRMLAGVRIALLFSEGEPGVIRVNLRSEGKTTVVEIAKQFGGGGHSQSAGIRFRGIPMEQAVRDVVGKAEAHLRAMGAGL
jgi:phosphoesterase RecJ-like protein